MKNYTKIQQTKQNRASKKNTMRNFKREISAQKLVENESHFMSVMRYCQTELDTYTTVVSYDTALVTDAGGLITGVYTNNPTGYANWTNLAGVFDEYRVLGIEIEVEPNTFVGSNNFIFAPIAVVNDYDSVTALASYTSAALYSSYQEYPGLTRFRKLALMSGAENASFINTAAPTNTFGIKFYSAGNTVSTTVGRIRLKAVVQFRGKGV